MVSVLMSCFAIAHNVGSKGENLKLSNERANAVMNWLAAHGIDRFRLSAKGYGEARPVATNSTEEGRALPEP